MILCYHLSGKKTHINEGCVCVRVHLSVLGWTDPGLTALIVRT